MATRWMIDRKWIWTGASLCGIATLLMSSLIWAESAGLPIGPRLHADAAAKAASAANAATSNAANISAVPHLEHERTPASSPGAEAKPQPAETQQAAVTKVKRAALTFDDGPDDKFTPAVLNILKEYQVKATFFVVGKQVKKNPEMLRRIYEEGHAIGNHSFDHPDFSKLSSTRLEAEINQADQAIQDAAGITTPLFRAPFGALSEPLKKYLKATGRSLVKWTVDTRDWTGAPSEEILHAVQKQTKPNGIILMHSFGGKNGDLSNTVEALPKVIRYLQDQGYTLVTVPELPAK